MNYEEDSDVKLSEFNGNVTRLDVLKMSLQTNTAIDPIVAIERRKWQEKKERKEWPEW